MIEHLYAVNFRRFEEIDLRFDDDAQLILIDGNNGAGKTSILEAIHFALWGEGRAGRRHLDALVRRGAELEGMQVELTFHVQGESYRVNRRRDGKSSTAVLYCNEEPLVEGPNEVTEEIGNILGMDSAGFRLAVTAHQGDLEGLVSLRPAERARMVGRLLRLDAIAAARQAAADQARQERLLASKLAPEDTDDSAEQLKELQERSDALEKEKEAAEAAAAELSARLDSLSEAAEEFSAQRAAHAQLLGRAQLLQQQLEQVRSELDELGEEDEPEPEPQEDVEDLERRASVLAAELARAEAAVDRARHRRSLQRDVAEIDARLAELDGARTPEAPETTPEMLQEGLAAAEQRSRDAAVERDMAAGELKRLQLQEDLGDVCRECGQTITEQHRENHRQQRQQEQEQQQQRLRQAEEELDRAGEALAQERRRMEAAVAAAGEHRLAVQAHLQRQEEAEQLRIRKRTYQQRIVELPEAQTDPAPLKAELAELEKKLPLARLQEEKRKGRLRRAEQRRQLTDRVQALSEQHLQAAEAAGAAEPPARLRNAAAESEELRGSIEAERTLASHLATERAVTVERIAGVKAQQKRRAGQSEKAAGHQKAAENAAGAQRLLQEAGGRMAQRIRPELEGAVNALLEQMSEGRFTRASIDEEYRVGVLDDGEFRDITDLSGGEADLVALALRLALAQVFTARNGGSGAGFLILDECFGSQDPDRRRAILEALRSLRGQYRQIFVISHVEGLQEAADLVLHVQRHTDEPSDVQQEA